MPDAKQILRLLKEGSYNFDRPADVILDELALVIVYLAAQIEGGKDVTP